MADLFRGEFQSKIICTTCGSIRTTNEPFLTLSLPIVKEKSKLVLHPLLQFPGNPFSTKRLSLTLKESDVGMGKTKDVLLAAGVDAEAHIVYAICDPEKVYSLSVNRLGEIAVLLRDEKAARGAGVVRSLYGAALHRPVRRGDRFTIWAEQTGGLTIKDASAF